MSTHKRINGNYDITTLGASDVVTISSSAVTVTGNLTVSGTQTTVNSQDTDIQDRVIVLNKGEAGAGVTGGTSGLEVDRGSSTNSRIVYDESNDKWSIDNGSGSLTPIASSASGLGLENIVEDTTPQLGGTLDVNDQTISGSSSGAGDVTILAGEANLDVDAVRVLNNPGTPSSEAGYNKLYAATPASGGTGLFVTNSTATEELVSKSKAIVFGIIF